MFIKIEFKQSEIKGYSGEQEYKNYVENKTIPEEIRMNIFTKDEIDKLNSILDKPLNVKEIKTWCLQNKTIFKNDWFYGDDKEQKEREYNDSYNNSEDINLYTVKNSESYIVDSDLLFITTNKFTTKVLYTVVGTLKDIPSATQISEHKVLQTLFNLEEKLNMFDKTQQFNTKVGVHISDLGLLNVKEVDVLVDVCTDELQEWLNEGWRILAICPQPDSRRPDYILGRNERMVGRERRQATCGR